MYSICKVLISEQQLDDLLALRCCTENCCTLAIFDAPKHTFPSGMQRTSFATFQTRLSNKVLHICGLCFISGTLSPVPPQVWLEHWP